MPLYEYKCQKCDYEFDEISRVDDRYKPTKKACPDCKKRGKIILKVSQTNVIDPYLLGKQKPSVAYKELINYHKKKTPRGNFGKDKL